MAGTGKRSRPRDGGLVRPPRRGESERVPAGQGTFGANGATAPDVVLYVVGGTGPDRHPAHRHFLLVNRRKGEPEAAHLKRIVPLIEEAIAAGGTHLLVPPELVDWLGDHPLVANYFAAEHDLAEAGAKTGIIFAFIPHSRQPVTFAAEIAGWEIVPANPTPCLNDTQCCSGVCGNGICQFEECAELGQACNENEVAGNLIFCCGVTGSAFAFCNQTGTAAGTCAQCVAPGATCNPQVNSGFTCCGELRCEGDTLDATTGTCQPITADA